LVVDGADDADEAAERFCFLASPFLISAFFPFPFCFIMALNSFPLRGLVQISVAAGAWSAMVIA
jgi:hypothetical protein